MHQDKIEAFERTVADDYANIAGIVVLKDGAARYAKAFHGYAAEDAVHVASVTKSVVSALIGIAIDKGYIDSVRQQVLHFFPRYAVPAGEETIRRVTIENLLTMTAPYKYETEPYEAFFASENWVHAALDLLGGAAHTGAFQYSPIIGAHILSGILAEATGRPVLDFAVEHLFSPLGIDVAENVAFRDAQEQLAWYAKDRHAGSWVVDPQGINTASWGLCLTPMDMAKIGQLYLSGGVWAGKQVLSPAWIGESVKAQAGGRSLTWHTATCGGYWTPARRCTRRWATAAT